MNLTENINEFSKDIKERLSSPFFSSFIIAWIIFNWEIPVALIFYDKQMLQSDGYNSYIKFLKGQFDEKYWFTYPLYSALSYCLIYPVFRNLFSAAQAWFKSWGSKWNLMWSRSGKISVTDYIDLRENFDKRTVVLEDLIKHQNESLKEYDKIKTQFLDKEKTISNLNTEIYKWRNNSNMITGNWSLRIEEGSNSKEQKISIANGQIYNIETMNSLALATITHFQFIPNARQIYMITDSIGNITPLFTNRQFFLLGINETGELLTGERDLQARIAMTKIKFSS